MEESGAKYGRVHKLQEIKMVNKAELNVFNIPANYDFFATFFVWIKNNFLSDLEDVRIFLPNQRSCRELRQMFLQDSVQFLPQIKAINEISFEDFFEFLPQNDVKEIIDEALKIKTISGLDNLLFLSDEIKKTSLFGENLDEAQTLATAIHLKNLFEEIEREEITLEKINEIDDSELSQHRQITLDFLKRFHIRLKNSLIKKDLVLSSSYQNFLSEKFSEILQKYGSKTPIVIAGSTGSVPSSRRLIKAIANQKNGYVILHSFDPTQNFDAENHPQFFLNQLIHSLEITAKNVKTIADSKFIISSESTHKLISQLMLPAEKTYEWQRISIENCNNFRFIEAKDEISESKIIAEILSAELNKNYFSTKKLAVVTNNEKLATLLKSRLKEMSLPFNDSRNLGVKSSKLANFILLLLQLIENDFESSTLLSVMQNPLCYIENKEDFLIRFENEILRQDRLNKGLEGISAKLLYSDLKIIFDDFYQKISPLLSPKDKKISRYVTIVKTVISDLAGQKFVDILSHDPANEELSEFFNALEKKHDFIINPTKSRAVFELLFSQISFFEKSDATSPIQILSTLEARLLNFDLMIVASLNEGDFPQIEGDNWLGRKIRKDLGIDKTLKKIGQNAYDFCNYLSNKEVILTRSLTNNGAPSSPSPFLLKLQTLLKKLKTDFVIENNFNTEEVFDGIKTKRPQPKPAIDLRPKKLAITDIAKLISDPYSIYAKRILRLRQLQEIDFEPGYAEFGSFVHKALEEFIKNPLSFDEAIKNSQKIFDDFFLSQEAKLLWWPKFENIFGKFFAKEQELKFIRNLTEQEVQMVCEEILLNGKIDRIAFDADQSAIIFDYKTGSIPSKKEVFSGTQPQLTLAALMLVESGFANEIKSLNYWKLSFSGEDDLNEISKNCEEIKILIAAAKSGLARLLKYFSTENNGYIAAPNLENYYENEYSHLARIKEWQ